MVVSHCIGSLLGKMLAKFNIIYLVRQSLDHIFGNISQTEISSLWSAFTFRGPMLDNIFSRSGIGGVGIHSKWLLIIIADISCIYGRSAIVLYLICIASVGINRHESVGIVTQQCRVVGRKQTVWLQTFLIFLYVVNSCMFPTFSTHISRRVRSPLLFVVRTGLLEGRARRESLINLISLGWWVPRNGFPRKRGLGIGWGVRLLLMCPGL